MPFLAGPESRRGFRTGRAKELAMTPEKPPIPALGEEFEKAAIRGGQRTAGL